MLKKVQGLLTAGSGPTPLNLQLLSSCLQQASQLLECPVCLEAVKPPVWQCCHGHLLCSGCRARSDRCPLCRVPLGPRGRSLLADKLHDLLSQTYQRYSEQRQGQPPGAQDDPAPPPAAEHQDAAVEQRAGVLTRGLRMTASSEDVSATSTPGGLGPAAQQQPARARSQSAGHIGVVVAEAVVKDDPLVHCPYGSACPNTCPASEVFNHLREDHDGPLLQYFPREGRELSLPRPEPEAPERRASLTALTTKAGETVFLHAERGRMWLWALAASATAPSAPAAPETTTSPSGCSELRVDFPEDAEQRLLLPVFPLTASCDDVIASGRCVRVPLQDVRISVRVGPGVTGS
ncbi:E3 ubiquitin-protein ligase DIS1 [Frankliniella fusca]|uniref:E3 ubiquitin-protein ligase DIS1 n=1 Tax=Frankliniella fusca TaxID=407009 RepID=A0AAE1L941_9NEOP|nr:E3 ubiquitin-protein ligase DIS1 [Frankliniella fusca]